MLIQFPRIHALSLLKQKPYRYYYIFNVSVKLSPPCLQSEHSFRKKASILLTRILENNEDKFVIAMPPSGLMDYYWRVIKKDESIITIALKDKATNIFKRIRFYDDYLRPIEIKIAKEKEKYYLKDISLDIEYFGRTYKRARIKYDICGKSAFQTADDLYELLSG